MTTTQPAPNSPLVIHALKTTLFGKPLRLASTILSVLDDATHEESLVALDLVRSYIGSQGGKADEARDHKRLRVRPKGDVTPDAPYAPPKASKANGAAAGDTRLRSPTTGSVLTGIALLNKHGAMVRGVLLGSNIALHATQIAKATGLDLEIVSKTLARLIDKGLVRRGGSYFRLTTEPKKTLTFAESTKKKPTKKKTSKKGGN